MTDKSESLTEVERKNLQSLITFLEHFTNLKPNIPAYQITAFLRLALDEGKSVKHYSETGDLATSTMSRAFLDLGKKNRQGEQGMMLVEDKPSLRSLRTHEMYLTSKGRALLWKVLKGLKRGSSKEAI